MSHEFRELFINELYKSFSEIEISKTDYSELDTEEKQINKLLELLEEIKTLLEESKSKRDIINDECINPYFARLDTLAEIIKLITK